jgi:hypothetical protein
MRKFLIAALLVSLLVVGTVYAQGITYNTGFQVQNLGSGVANLTITFYDQAGNIVAQLSGPDHTVAAGASKRYFPLPPEVPNGFNGSVVIASDQPVAAIANELGNGQEFGASYAGFSAGATEVNLPLIFRNHAGFNTWFNVQNAGTADASVTVQYTPSPGQDGNAATQTATIKPGAAHSFFQVDNNDLGSHFVGSARVTSNQPVVATCNQVGPTTLLAYDGFITRQKTLAFPLVNHLNAGYITGIQIMNIGTSSTNVTVSYTPSIAGTASTETKSIPAGGSVTFALNHLTSRFVGSARVTANSADQDLVAVVNQLNSGARKGASYGGFDPASGTEAVSVPLVMARNGPWYTGVTVQNVGSSSTVVTLNYSDGSGPYTETVAAGQSWVVNQNNHFAGTFVGSATFTAGTGGQIIAVCNELNSVEPGDTFLVYEGFNY